MSGIQSQLDALGVGLVFVGSGEAAYALDFQTEQHITAPLYVAPDLNAYQALGFKNDVWSTFSPAVMVHAARAALAGFRQGATQGAALQQGGVLLLDAQGEIAWVYRSNEAGDHPSSEEILARARAL